jgi:simple sugar transport system ATP-binding protein
MSASTMYALELSGIAKRYGTFSALDDVTLLVRPGTIHALLGENGAGKTTLMHVAYGMVPPDAGRIHLNGRETRLASPIDAISARIGMVHQHFTLVPAMTVAENLALGGHGLLRSRDMTARVRAIGERTGFALDPDALVETLPVGAQQRVEIAKALAREATLLILDEPTAVLAPAEAEELLRWLQRYVSAGNAAVIITHKLREALAVADDVTVLRRGRVALRNVASETSAEALTRAMIGTAAPEELESHPPRSHSTGTAVIRAEHVMVADRAGRMWVRDATFEIHGGEIVGVAAIEGAGHRELLRALAGRQNISAGRLERPAHVGFVPEDRHHDAVLLDRSLAENVALRGVGPRRGLMDWKAVHARTTKLMQAFDVRASSARSSVRSLSGGNQQKLVIGRELEALPGELAPLALVVENPTRGLDVRASVAVHDRLRTASANGAAVVVYSSDLDEVLALSSRVLVVFDGIVREMPVDRDAVGRAMMGLS